MMTHTTQPATVPRSLVVGLGTSLAAAAALFFVSYNSYASPPLTSAPPIAGPSSNHVITSGPATTDLGTIPPPPANILPAHGRYKRWKGSWRSRTKDGVVTKTYVYTITRIDGSTYQKTIIKQSKAPPPPPAYAFCGASMSCKPSKADFQKALTAAAQVSPLNAAVVRYSYDHFGQAVGNGQCWTLAAEALKAGHGVDMWSYAAPGRPYRWPNRPGGSDPYVFSKKTTTTEKAAPGDILQFSWAIFKHHNKKTGWYYSAQAGDKESHGHHTAVVFRNMGSNELQVLEQNVGKVLKVQFGTYDFNDLKSGGVIVYQPEGAADPQCKTGIKSGAVCCAKSCGKCGGTGCNLRGSNCCGGTIIKSKVSCDNSPPPCNIETDPQCKTGISSGGVCCAKLCGKCGGTGCNLRPGGANNCCGSTIINSKATCTNGGPPCNMISKT